MTWASCLAGTGLTPEQLTYPSHELQGRQELAVLRNILRALGPAVPFPVMAGLRYRPTTHGMWGFAIMSSPDARSAVDVALRHFDVSFSFNRIRFEVVGHDGRFYYEDSDNPDDLRAALVERDLAALVTLERDVYGQVQPALSLRLRGRRPVYAAVLESLFSVEPQFGADANCLTFDAALLSLRLPLADDFGLHLSEEQCRLAVARRSAQSGVAGQVRAHILRNPGEFPGMSSVARELGLSTRTLHNKLTREGTSYRQLLEEIREPLAEELLVSSALTVEEITKRLGYADPSSFTAAFKRWKGVPPKNYRRTRIGR